MACLLTRDLSLCNTTPVRCQHGKEATLSLRAAAGLSKMEGSPPASFALRLLLLAVLPAAGWLMTVTNELPQPPQAPKVGQGGRSAAPPHAPSGEARAGAVGLRRPHRRLLPPAGGPGAGVRVPKTEEGRSIQGNGGSLGEGGERARRVT